MARKPVVTTFVKNLLGGGAERVAEMLAEARATGRTISAKAVGAATKSAAKK